MDVMGRQIHLEPDGFSSLADVIDPAELEKIVSDYAQASGQSAADQLPGGMSVAITPI
jgi:hypothetical protein